MAKVKAWFFEKFLSSLNKAAQTITEQFDDEILLEGADENRIFDIHGDRIMDVPFTERSLVGDKFFMLIFNGTNCFDRGEDGFKKADRLLSQLDRARSRAADSIFDLDDPFD